MEVYDAIRTILAVRAYQDKPVPAELVLRIVEAGRLTGSSMNGQPWHFILVEDSETLKKTRSLGPQRTLYCPGPTGDCCCNGEIHLRGFRCEPRHPVNDPDGLVGGGCIQLGRL